MLGRKALLFYNTWHSEKHELLTIDLNTFFPQSVWTVLFLGSNSATLDLTHVTPDGITLSVDRPEVARLLAPAPTNVHIGW